MSVPDAQKLVYYLAASIIIADALLLARWAPVFFRVAPRVFSFQATVQSWALHQWPGREIAKRMNPGGVWADVTFYRVSATEILFAEVKGFHVRSGLFGTIRVDEASCTVSVSAKVPWTVLAALAVLNVALVADWRWYWIAVECVVLGLWALLQASRFERLQEAIQAMIGAREIAPAPLA